MAYHLPDAHAARDDPDAGGAEPCQRRRLLFYAEKLGFVARHQEGGFAIVRRDDAELHLTQLADESWRQRPDLAARPVVSGAESFLPGTGTCRIRVEGIDELWAELEPRGVVHPNGRLREQWWGDRDFSVLDVDGNGIAFFERRTT
jgi:hypothetical protein